MTATWLWARSELRARWRSWVVLGILGGAVFGLAAAGIAGARRTDDAVPDFSAASRFPRAGVLANDPRFDEAQRRAIAALPEVRATYPFAVGIALELRPNGFDSALLPTAPRSVAPMVGVLVRGRLPDPARTDEVVVDENASRRFGLGLGDVLRVSQTARPEEVASAPPGLVPARDDLTFRVPMRVVGIAKSVSGDLNWIPSSGFWKEYGPRTVGFVNLFVDLRPGTDFAAFQTDVQRIVGHPVNVTDFDQGVQKTQDVTNIEALGLLLFALSVVVGGGVLVGQALVRAVTAAGADLPTWQAIGADRRTVVRALTIPALLSAAVGAVTIAIVAIAVSPRFPIGVARQYDLDVGLHADWLVIGASVATLVVLTAAAAAVTARWQLARIRRLPTPGTGAVRWASALGRTPALLVGTRLASEPGRGRRAVPVRSALVGAIVGVIGVVACFTFRAGISDAVTSPERSGITWEYVVFSGAGTVRAADLRAIERDPAAASILDAVWDRAVRIDKTATPTFGTAAVKGKLDFVVLHGRAPGAPDELALAPSTASSLGLHVGDRVPVGPGSGHPVHVVGIALLPATSHTDYDQGAWMTAAGLRAAQGNARLGVDDLQDQVLVHWKPGADVRAAEQRIRKLSGNANVFDAMPATLPTSVTDLGRLRALPFALGVFFALLASATVAHALVTTVRRRKHDLAVLRTIGFTRGQTRVAIAWQATLLALVGVVVGVPLGIVVGRLTWRWVADNFPVVYVPPLALLAVVLVVPAAVMIANLLAAAPGRSAARLRPAETLRTE